MRNLSSIEDEGSPSASRDRWAGSSRRQQAAPKKRLSSVAQNKENKGRGSYVPTASKATVPAPAYKATASKATAPAPASKANTLDTSPVSCCYAHLKNIKKDNLYKLFALKEKMFDYILININYQ